MPGAGEHCRRTVLFAGHVQGVGFRYTVERIARRFRVTGYVRNLRDGRVEVVAEGASEELGRFVAQIEEAINRTQNELGIVPRRDWLQGHYQFCNRVVALNHLLAHGVPARLVFVDFCGDTHFADRAMAPQDWQPSLRALEQHVGRPFPPRVESRLHDVFLNVNPMA